MGANSNTNQFISKDVIAVTNPTRFHPSKSQVFKKINRFPSFKCQVSRN